MPFGQIGRNPPRLASQQIQRMSYAWLDRLFHHAHDSPLGGPLWPIQHNHPMLNMPCICHS